MPPKHQSALGRKVCRCAGRNRETRTQRKSQRTTRRWRREREDENKEMQGCDRREGERCQHTDSGATTKTENAKRPRPRRNVDGRATSTYPAHPFFRTLDWAFGMVSGALSRALCTAQRSPCTGTDHSFGPCTGYDRKASLFPLLPTSTFFSTPQHFACGAAAAYALATLPQGFRPGMKTALFEVPTSHSGAVLACTRAGSSQVPVARVCLAAGASTCRPWSCNVVPKTCDFHKLHRCVDGHQRTPQPTLPRMPSPQHRVGTAGSSPSPSLLLPVVVPTTTERNERSERSERRNE